MTEIDTGLLDTLFDRMPMAIALFDRDLRVVRWNAVWEESVSRFRGDTPAVEPAGMHVFDLVPGVKRWAVAVAERVLAGETVRVDPLEMPTPDGVTYWDSVFAPVTEGGEVVGIVEVASDVTERVRAWDELESRVDERTSELARRQEVAEGLHHILDILNGCCPEQEVLDYIIAESRRLLGSDAISVYRLEVEAGLLHMEAVRGLDDEAVSALQIPVLGGGIVGQTIMQRKPMVMPDVEPLLVNALQQMPPEQVEILRAVLTRYRAILAVPLVVNDEVYGGLAMYYPEPREFTDEEVALAEDLADHLALAIENARLREAAEVSAVAEERSRLARDLHDAVTQTLFSASLIADVLPQLWERDPDEARKRLAQLRELTRGALAEMRSLLLELRPAALEAADIGDLLRQLAEAAGGRCGAQIEVAVSGEVELPADVKVVFYRVAQEALNNVVRHAGACNARVELRAGAGHVSMSVIDDGQGFAHAASAESFGLGIMRERAESVGALLQVDSEAGEGTRVTLVWKPAKGGGRGL